MSIIKNKVLIYLSTRYLTYGLQFIQSLIIAVRLGPYYLGVYGLIQLIISYFEQINFGIPHSLNVLLVHNKHDRELQDAYTLNSLAIFSILNVISFVVALYLCFKGNITWGEFKIDKYIFLIVLTAILSYYNSVLTMVVRFRNQVNILSIVGTLPVIVNFIVIFFFEEESLVFALFVAVLFSYVLNLSIFYNIGAVPRLAFNELSVSCQIRIVRKGLYLFLYNSCFYLILIGVRTLISRNYTVEEYGYFTFSFTIANAVMLLLSSLSTIIFPKTIDMMSGNDVEEKKNAIQKLRIGYITTANLLIYFALMCFPIVTMIFSKYEPALTSMNLIALAILMNTNSYGYITLLIAQNKEKLTSRLSFSALVLSLMVGSLLVYVLYVDFSYVILSVMCGYLLFSFLGYYYGNKELFGRASFIYAVKNFFPSKYSFPYAVAIGLSVIQFEKFLWVPFILFIILNYKDFKKLMELLLKLIKNPNIIDV